MPGKSKLKEHLEDLAQRHPEIADQLKGLADIDSDIPRQTSRERLFQEGSRSGKSNSFDKDQQDSKLHSTEDKQRKDDAAEQGPSKVNLRSTVPDMQSSQAPQQDQPRSNRSQSAPPEASQPPNQQFMGSTATKGPHHGGGPIEIPIQMDSDPHSQNQQNVDASQPRPHPGQQLPHGRAQERYIPIFVEGRGETIVNVPSDKNSTSSVPSQPAPPPQPHHPPHQQHQFKSTPTPPPPPPPSSSSQPASSAPSQTEVEPPVTQQQQQPHQAAPQPPPPPRPPSPLSQVASVQKEVEELKQRVDAFNGTSKTDKEYIFLDEMLTRNLLKLDNIDTEGKDEVRAARKNVIKLIQECINKLESFVPNQNTT